MPAIASQSINDGTIAKTYVPVSTSGNTVVFADTSANSAAGQSRLRVAFDPSNSSRRTSRLTLDLSVPYEETVNSSPLVRNVARAQLSIVIPDAVPATERARLASLVKNALALASVQTCITSPEAFY